MRQWSSNDPPSQEVLFPYSPALMTPSSSEAGGGGGGGGAPAMRQMPEPLRVCWARKSSASETAQRMVTVPSPGMGLSWPSPVERLRANSMVVQPPDSVPLKAVMSKVPPWSVSAGWGPVVPVE